MPREPWALCSGILQPRIWSQEPLPPHQPAGSGAAASHALGWRQAGPQGLAQREISIAEEGWDPFLCPCQCICIPLQKASPTHAFAITKIGACIPPPRLPSGEEVEPCRIWLYECSPSPRLISPIITCFLLQPRLLKLWALILSLWRPPSD